MEHEEELAVRLHGDPFAEPVQIDDAATHHGGERRLDRAQQEGRREADRLDATAQDSGPQRVEVEENVRQFRHGGPA